MLGVEFADHDMGSYRFKRGLGTYNEVRSKSSHENNDEAEQQWASNELKRESLAETAGRFLKPLAHSTNIFSTNSTFARSPEHLIGNCCRR